MSLQKRRDLPWVLFYALVIFLLLGQTAAAPPEAVASPESAQSTSSAVYVAASKVGCGGMA